jgi:hypothetical protein
MTAYGGAGIAVDASGNTYVSGYIGGTAFVDKLNPSGSAILYSTLIAGGTTPGLDMALDSAGNVYLAGTTLSSSFAVTANAYQSTCNPGDSASCSPDGDVFVTKLNASGVPVYSSYLGGADGDQGIAVAADNSGKVYVTGNTVSTNFPTKTPIQSCAAHGTSQSSTRPSAVRPRSSTALAWAATAPIGATTSRSTPLARPISPATPPRPTS